MRKVTKNIPVGKFRKKITRRAYPISEFAGKITRRNVVVPAKNRTIKRRGTGSEFDGKIIREMYRIYLTKKQLRNFCDNIKRENEAKEFNKMDMYVCIVREKRSTLENIPECNEVIEKLIEKSFVKFYLKLIQYLRVCSLQL